LALILEQDVENRDSPQRDIEGGLAVLRRLHELRGTRRNGDDDPGQREASLPGNSPKDVPERTDADLSASASSLAGVPETRITGRITKTP
jgi:hypothetical protein